MNNQIADFRGKKVLPNTRLRQDGKTVSKDDIQNKIIDLLGRKPHTPTMLADACNLTRQWISTEYLYPLFKDGIIRKVEGTHQYELADAKTTKNDVIREAIASTNEFLQCDVIKNWAKKKPNSIHAKERQQFANVCMGLYGDFKINPDAWMHPDTTIECVAMLDKYYGITAPDEMPTSMRQTIRHFLKYGLEYQLDKEEGEELRISGQKPEPKASRLDLPDEDYPKVKALMNEHSRTVFVKGGMRLWMGFRPSVTYTIRCDELEFYDRTVQYIEVDGEKITDKKFINILKKANPELEIKTLKHRAVFAEIHEFKTNRKYPKYIYDEEIALALEEYTKERMKQGFTYLFWDNNETEFTKGNYLSLVENKVDGDNKIFKKIFLSLGMVGYSIKRANYAIRHFAIQRWLQATDYNYGFVAEMFHESIETLKDWYGKRTREKFEEKMQELIFV